jgi:hypothetical protein
LTIEHKNYDLNGKKGVLIIDDFEEVTEAPFNYKEVSATTSFNVTTDGEFEYIHALPATVGTAV